MGFEEEIVLCENQKEDLIKNNNSKNGLENRIKELEKNLYDYKALLLENQTTIKLIKSENNKLILEKDSRDTNISFYESRAKELENYNNLIKKEMSEKQFSLIENHKV